jgi:nitrate reductase NapE component
MSALPDYSWGGAKKSESQKELIGALGLIGFVFIGIVHSYLFVVHCKYIIYNPPTADKIGFVLHNRSYLDTRYSLV